MTNYPERGFKASGPEKSTNGSAKALTWENGTTLQSGKSATGACAVARASVPVSAAGSSKHPAGKA